MKKTILAFVLVLMTMGNAFATVIDFEDVPHMDIIPNGYAGFNWNNFYGLDASQYIHSGYQNGVASGTGVALNGYAADASISRVTPFNFGGAYLTGAWNNGLQLEVLGYKGDVLKYDTTITINSLDAIYFAFNYKAVDKVTFHSFGGSDAGYGGGGAHFVMDDLTYSRAKVAPIPGALWLLGSGLVGLVGFRRRSSGL
jgi:hypothetical protein